MILPTDCIDGFSEFAFHSLWTTDIVIYTPVDYSKKDILEYFDGYNEDEEVKREEDICAITIAGVAYHFVYKP